jgi:hypothetical protein
MQRFDKAFGATGRDYGKTGDGRTRQDIDKRRSDRFLFLFIAGMWFTGRIATGVSSPAAAIPTAAWAWP